MLKKPTTILSINPGTKYLALAIFRDAELRDWQIKNFKGKWSPEKMNAILTAIANLISRYEVTGLALKRLGPSRSSRALDTLVLSIKKAAIQKNLIIYEYFLKELENSFCPDGKANRKILAERVFLEYPILFKEFEKEQLHKHPYYLRLFEAVALGALCQDRMDRRQHGTNSGSSN
jgi:hypothetical protein